MKAAIAFGLVFAVGLAAGFIAGRWTAPAASVTIVEQTGLFAGPTELSTQEVFYPHPFAAPPELTIVEDRQDPGSRWEWQVVEQRRDGFKLKFLGLGGGSDSVRNKLRYTARGSLGSAPPLR
jgi:hypothetical protein